MEISGNIRGILKQCFLMLVKCNTRDTDPQAVFLIGIVSKENYVSLDVRSSVWLRGFGPSELSSTLINPISNALGRCQSECTLQIVLEKQVVLCTPSIRKST